MIYADNGICYLGYINVEITMQEMRLHKDFSLFSEIELSLRIVSSFGSCIVCRAVARVSQTIRLKKKSIPSFLFSKELRCHLEFMMFHLFCKFFSTPLLTDLEKNFFWKFSKFQWFCYV